MSNLHRCDHADHPRCPLPTCRHASEHEWRKGCDPIHCIGDRGRVVFRRVECVPVGKEKP